MNMITTRFLSNFYSLAWWKKKTVVEVYISLYVIEIGLLNSKIENIVLVPLFVYGRIVNNR